MPEWGRPVSGWLVHVLHSRGKLARTVACAYLIAPDSANVQVRCAAPKVDPATWLHPRSTLLHGCTQGRPCYNGWGLAGSEAAAAALHQLRWLASASLALHQHPPAGSNVRLPNRREGGCCVAVPTLSPRPRHRFLGTWKAGQIPGSQGPHGHAWHVVRVSVLFLCCSETPHPLDIIRKPCCYY